MRLAEQAAGAEQVFHRQFRAVEQPSTRVVTVDAFCFEMLETGHETLTQRAVQTGSRGQACGRYRFQDRNNIQLQGDGAEHLGQRLAAVDANALVLQDCRQISEIRARMGEALRPQASGVVVLHQQAQWLTLFEHRSEEHTSELQSLMRHSYAV